MGSAQRKVFAGRRIEGALKSDEMAFEYAWRWSQYLYTQRTTMFNFCLVVQTLMLGGLLSVFKELKNLPGPIAMSVCVTGAALTLLFLLIDLRNRHLIEAGEDVLFELEENSPLFAAFRTGSCAKRHGLLRREKLENARWSLLRHRFLMPEIYLIFFLAMCAIAASVAGLPSLYIGIGLGVMAVVGSGVIAVLP